MVSSLPEWLEIIIVTLESILFLLMGSLFLAAPLTIQWILYPITKLFLKKIPSCIIYLICLGVNTILLHGLYEWLAYSGEPVEDHQELLGVLVIIQIWILFYIGILISCIIRIIKAVIKAVKTARRNSGGLD